MPAQGRRCDPSLPSHCTAQRHRCFSAAPARSPGLTPRGLDGHAVPCCARMRLSGRCRARAYIQDGFARARARALILLGLGRAPRVARTHLARRDISGHRRLWRGQPWRWRRRVHRDYDGPAPALFIARAGPPGLRRRRWRRPVLRQLLLPLGFLLLLLGLNLRRRLPPLLLLLLLLLSAVRLSLPRRRFLVPRGGARRRPRRRHVHPGIRPSPGRR